MLNFIYYPVSAIMWFWHEVFGFVLGPASGLGWALSVIFLVFTLRALLIKPFISQVRSMRKMQEFQPQIKKLQEKYKNDRTKLAEEMQKLQKEHGVNPSAAVSPSWCSCRSSSACSTCSAGSSRTTRTTTSSTAPTSSRSPTPTSSACG